MGSWGWVEGPEARLVALDSLLQIGRVLSRGKHGCRAPVGGRGGLRGDHRPWDSKEGRVKLPVSDPEAGSGQHVSSSPSVPENDVGSAVPANPLCALCTTVLTESLCTSTGTWAPQLSNLCSDRLTAPLAYQSMGRWTEERGLEIPRLLAQWGSH